MKGKKRKPLDLAIEMECNLALFRDLFRSLGASRGGPMELGRKGQWAMASLLGRMSRQAKELRTFIDEQSLKRAKKKDAR